MNSRQKSFALLLASCTSFTYCVKPCEDSQGGTEVCSSSDAIPEPGSALLQQQRSKVLGASINAPLSLGDTDAIASEVLRLLEKAWESPPAQQVGTSLLEVGSSLRKAVGESRLDPVQQAHGAQRLHIINVLGEADVEKAKLVQSATKPTMGPEDAMSHICGPACTRKAQGSLEDLCTMPTSAYPKNYSNGYQIASAVKFPFGLVHIVQREHNRTEGGPNMARWFLIKDIDVYVNAERLMAQVSEYDPTKPYAFGTLHGGCPGICGGGGFLLSRALAEELAFTHPHKWQTMMMATLYAPESTFYWDVHVPEIVKWVEGAQLSNLPSLLPYGPFDQLCTDEEPQGGFVKDKDHPCFEVPECKCAWSPSPATYHLKSHTEEAVKFFLNGTAA